MKKTNSTKKGKTMSKIKNTHPIAIAMSNTGDIRSFLTSGGATSEEAESLLQIFANRSTQAALAENLYPGQEITASDITRFRNRFGTICQNAFREAFDKAGIKAEYGFTSNRGRTPGDPVIHALKNAAKDSVSATRTALEMEPRGRVPIDKMRDYNSNLLANFKASLPSVREAHGTLPKFDELVETYLDKYLVAEDVIAGHELNAAVIEAASEAVKSARTACGREGRQHIAEEHVEKYNREVLKAFKENLKSVRETHGSLPDTIDNLVEAHISFYTVEEEKPTSSKRKKTEETATVETETEAVTV